MISIIIKSSNLKYCLILLFVLGACSGITRDETVSVQAEYQLKPGYGIIAGVITNVAPGTDSAAITLEAPDGKHLASLYTTEEGKYKFILFNIPVGEYDMAVTTGSPNLKSTYPVVIKSDSMIIETFPAPIDSNYYVPVDSFSLPPGFHGYDQNIEPLNNPSIETLEDPDLFSLLRNSKAYQTFMVEINKDIIEYFIDGGVAYVEK